MEHNETFHNASPFPTNEECPACEAKGSIRSFESGATRDTDHGKLDYDGFLSPLVIQRYAQYMHKHRIQTDGTLRDSGNWKKGIPKDAYMKSMWRHFYAVWAHANGYGDIVNESLEDSLCALLFNATGFLHELLKEDYRATNNR